MPQNSKNIFSGLPLWDHFEKNADTTQVALVEQHIDSVMPLLDYYIKAFLTYTIHNGQHQKNVVSIIGNLLGKAVVFWISKWLSAHYISCLFIGFVLEKDIPF